MRLVTLFCICTLIAPTFCMEKPSGGPVNDWSSSLRYDQPVTHVQPGERESLLPHDQQKSWKPWACAYGCCAFTVCSLWAMATVCG